MMKFGQLTAWLEDNGYYELDYQLGELLVLKAITTLHVMDYLN